MQPTRSDIAFAFIFSRAVAAYAVSQYGAQQGKQSLYPADPKKRATVDQHLYISENTVEKVVSYVVRL